ncbi:MAG TPA: glycosyltransferase family 87 protein [Terriglobales bacterium]|nr:glycosyltransferase family 87 protein [Terriglobales bacterium]
MLGDSCDTSWAPGVPDAPAEMQDWKARVWLWGLWVALIGAYAAGLVHSGERILGGGADFTSFYGAARIVYSGDGESLYRLETQQKAQSEWRHQPLPYLHPPFEVLLYLPLAPLPFAHAYVAFVLVNAALVGAVARFRLPNDPADGSVTLLQAVACLAFYPVFLAIAHGQDSLLLLLLFSLALVALKRGQEFRCGACLGLALFKFQFVLPLLVAFAWKKRVRVLTGVLVTAVLLVLLSMLLVGWRGVVEYPHFLLGTSRNPGLGIYDPAGMPNLRGLLTAILPGGSQSGALAMTALSLSLGLLVVAARQWPAMEPVPSAGLELAFALNVILALLVSYHLNGHDVSLMLLPVALIVRHLRAGRPGSRVRRAALCGLILALYYPPFLVPSAVVPPAPIFWVMLLLAGTLFVELRSEVRA